MPLMDAGNRLIWQALKLYLPEGTRLTSVRRTALEQLSLLKEKAEKEGFGVKKVNYKLRDWLFSRQRYWGEPIPLIHISYEEYAKLPRIEKIVDAKK